MYMHVLSLIHVDTYVSFFPHNRRIAMNTLTSTKTLAHRWVLISAGILLYGNGVLAAQPVGDAQQQARDLLLGTVNGQARTIDKFPVVAADRLQRSNPDPQEQARQMISGMPNRGSVAVGAAASTPAASTRSNHRTYSDPQEMARRLLLGQAASEIASSERTAAITER
jgi:hypothetical protein